MVNFYIGEIAVGRIVVEDVPTLWRKKVKAKLSEQENEGTAE